MHYCDDRSGILLHGQMQQSAEKYIGTYAVADPGWTRPPSC